MKSTKLSTVLIISLLMMTDGTASAQMLPYRVLEGYKDGQGTP